jgi:hypothetical protein
VALCRNFIERLMCQAHLLVLDGVEVKSYSDQVNSGHGESGIMWLVFVTS